MSLLNIIMLVVHLSILSSPRQSRLLLFTSWQKGKERKNVNKVRMNIVLKDEMRRKGVGGWSAEKHGQVSGSSSDL